MADAMRANPQTASDAPTRDKLLRETAEPKRKKSNTENVEPNRPTP
jgi:hypothetical protein